MVSVSFQITVKYVTHFLCDRAERSSSAVTPESVLLNHSYYVSWQIQSSMLVSMIFKCFLLNYAKNFFYHKFLTQSQTFQWATQHIAERKLHTELRIFLSNQCGQVKPGLGYGLLFLVKYSQNSLYFYSRVYIYIYTHTILVCSVC